MSERKAWTPEEDQVLKQLREDRHVRKWTEVSRLMEGEYGLAGRSGKQCRERYLNHLDASINRQEWNSQEEELLMALHNQMGNKWAEISRLMPGRSQNCVKNQLYSILRRGLRCINVTIRSQLKRYKQLPVDTIYKLVEASEATHRQPDPTAHAQESLSLKKALLALACTQFDLSQMKLLIERIKIFRKNSHNITIAQDSCSLSSQQLHSTVSLHSHLHPDIHEKPIESICLEKNQSEIQVQSTKEVVPPPLTPQQLIDSRLLQLCSLDICPQPESPMMHIISTPKPPSSFLFWPFLEQESEWND